MELTARDFARTIGPELRHYPGYDAAGLNAECAEAEIGAEDADDAQLGQDADDGPLPDAFYSAQCKLHRADRSCLDLPASPQSLAAVTPSAMAVSWRSSLNVQVGKCLVQCRVFFVPQYSSATNNRGLAR